MLLFVGIYILANPALCYDLNDYAQSTLVQFVHHFSELYGPQQIVYNVHGVTHFANGVTHFANGVTHLANDSKNFGCLDKFSAFPFENYLGCLKRLVRQPTFPLLVIKRLLEMSNIHTPHIHIPLSFPALRQQHLRGPAIPGELYEPCTQYGEVHCRSYCIGVRRSNNCIQVGNKIGIVQNIIRSPSGIYIIHKRFHPMNLYLITLLIPLSLAYMGCLVLATHCM